MVKSKIHAGTVKHVHLIIFGSDESVLTNSPSRKNPMRAGHGQKIVLKLKENKVKR